MTGTAAPLENMGGAPLRMRLTRERGTRRLLGLLAAIAILWYVAGQIQDHFLLSRKWPPLTPDMQGLTVVGALNPRGAYDRSLFKIFTETGASRVALTEWGWNSIFDPANGPMCSPTNGNIIEGALNRDSLAGDAMLAPYVHAAVQFELGAKGAFQALTRQAPITVPPETTHGAPEHTTLGALLDRFSNEPSSGSGDQGESASSGGGSESGRSVEQVVNLSPDTVAQALPVVLTGRDFSGAWLEEQPYNLITGEAYTVHLDLTPEGRSRFFQWSHAHATEDLVFVLKHSVVMAPRMSEPLDVNEWGVTNVTDKSMAQAIVNYVNGEAKQGR